MVVVGTSGMLGEVFWGRWGMLGEGLEGKMGYHRLYHCHFRFKKTEK